MMSAPIIEILLFAAVTVFLAYRLWGVLGTRSGFEDPSKGISTRDVRAEPDRPEEASVIPLRPDRQPSSADATEEAPKEEPDLAKLPKDDPRRAPLLAMKAVEPGFTLDSFLAGAKQAYEMIFLAYADGDADRLAPLLSEDVLEDFVQVIEDRRARKLSVEARFIGIREAAVERLSFDERTQRAEISVRFVADLITAVRDASDLVIEGDPKTIARRVENWTFERDFGSPNPNWTLVET